MGLRLKDGVSVRGVRPEIVLAALVAEGVYREYAADCTATACTDGKHSRGSLHYAGQALDLRTRHLGLIPDQVQAIRAELAGPLGAEYDVVLEDLGGKNEHIHVEFQPKGPIS